MHKLIKLYLLGLIAFFSSNVSAQEIMTKKGYTLTFESNDEKLDSKVKAGLIETFFEVYPRLAAHYNVNTTRQVRFRVDTAYKGVAAASGGRVVFSSTWLQRHPGDIDVVTHEVMHLVQNYGNTNGPGWLTEGIADYARHKFGVDNAGANWALGKYKQGQSYTNSYRITASFLNWLELTQYAGIVIKLDQQMRANTYTADLWKTLTGKSIDELWAEYAKS